MLRQSRIAGSSGTSCRNDQSMDGLYYKRSQREKSMLLFSRNANDTVMVMRFNLAGS